MTRPPAHSLPAETFDEDHVALFQDGRETRGSQMAMASSVELEDKELWAEVTEKSASCRQRILRGIFSIVKAERGCRSGKGEDKRQLEVNG